MVVPLGTAAIQFSDEKYFELVTVSASGPMYEANRWGILILRFQSSGWASFVLPVIKSADKASTTVVLGTSRTSLNCGETPTVTAVAGGSQSSHLPPNTLSSVHVDTLIVAGETNTSRKG